MSTDLSCQKTRSQFTRHLSLSARPRSTGGVGRHSQRHGEAVLPKRPGEALQTHPNHKCKIKGNSLKSRFGPKQEGGQVSAAGQCPSERGEVTTWCKNTPHRGEDGSRARRALRHPALVPSETRGRPTTTDSQSRQTYLPCTIRKDSRDTRSQPEFFNHLKRSRKTIFLNATPIRRDGRARTNRGNGFSPGLREQSPASPGPGVREQRQPRRAAIRLGYLTEKEQRGHTLRLPAFW